MKAIAIGITVAAAALAGCTVKETVVKPAETPPAVAYPQPSATSGGPRIAYTVMGESQFNQAAVQAANWCATNRYGNGARLVDHQRSTGGDVVTFACTGS
jgi:hypothetical protein